MQTLTEGRLTFRFPEASAWYALRYDDRTQPGFYKVRLEVIDGTKGVDFVAGARPDFRQVLLLEVKDFRGRQPELEAKLKPPTAAQVAQARAEGRELKMPLVLEVQQKALHTCAGLYLAAGLPADPQLDTWLLPELRTAMLRPPRLKLVLFLEQDPLPDSPHAQTTKKAAHNRITQRQDITKKLREKLKPLGIGSELAELAQMPHPTGWTAAPLPAATGP